VDAIKIGLTPDVCNGHICNCT